MNVAVVILNWNGKSLLKEFLPSVVSFSSEATIYVADNASTDDSVSFLKENFPQIKIIHNEVNGGFAKGYNDALKNLKEDLFILLNSDVAVTQDWLPPLINVFKDPAVAAAQPKILNYRKNAFFEYAGAAGGFIDALGYPYCRGRIFDTLEEDLGQYNDTLEVFWATGACMAVRRKDYWETGGFDEDFFAHQEEIDLCWRFYNGNKKVLAVGEAAVYHLGGGTLHNMHPKKTYYNFRNSLFSLTKNAPLPQLFGIIFLRLILDGIAGLKFLLELKPSHTVAILRAHFNFYLNFHSMWKKRGSLPKRKNYYGKFSILTAYYLFKLIRFEQLGNKNLKQF